MTCVRSCSRARPRARWCACRRPRCATSRRGPASRGSWSRPPRPDRRLTRRTSVCELLGMVSSVPTDLTFSFTGLALRGGQTGPHADGWGVALYDGRFARTFLEPHPAFSSRLARFVRENPIPTRLAIAHIRKMTRGAAAIQNTHPFVRVLHGRHLVFAHNGTLPQVRDRPLRFESPIGDTDSEHAFCVILDALRARYPTRYPEDPH